MFLNICLLNDCCILSVQGVFAACAWLAFHNDARENVYLRKPRVVQQDKHIAIIHQNFFPPTCLYDKDGYLT